MAIEASRRMRQWNPCLAAVPLLLLPVIFWFTMDFLHLMPTFQPPVSIAAVSFWANTDAAQLGDGTVDGSVDAVEPLSPPPPPPPPPPAAWDYWQKALISANATGLAPPVYHGNWMEAAHGRLRWFEDDGKPRQQRPFSWWGYADPAPQSPPPEEQADGSKDSGKGKGSRRRLAVSGSNSSGGANERTSLWRRHLTADDDAEERAKQDLEKKKTETWAASNPPLQARGPAPDAGGEENERSFFLPQILKDLRPWQKGGISEEDIQRAADLATPQGPYCYGDQLLFQIVKGRLYVDFRTSNLPMDGVDTRAGAGWFPSNEGVGLGVAKGHVQYFLFMLLDVLRAFPGQIPDVSGMMQTSDFPCVKRKRSTPDMQFRDPNLSLPETHYKERPIPVFGYNNKQGYYDLVVPDFTHFGHEYSQLTDPTGLMLNGLPQQVDLLAATHAFRPLERRKPLVMWRGRASNEPRDKIRRRFQACPKKLEAAGHDGAAALFDLVAPPLHEITDVTLKSNGKYRYPVYIDAGAYSSNLKQKLAVGSPMLVIKQRYHEWYTRELRAGFTHLDVPDNATMCEDAFAKVSLMQEMLEEQEAAIEAAAHPPPWLQKGANSWFAHPWGVNRGSDERTFNQLRNWTLAQRGIEAGGVNAYEDSPFYIEPPEPTADLLGPDIGGGNSTDGTSSGGAETAWAAGSRSGSGGRSGGWLLAWLRGEGPDERDAREWREAVAREAVAAEQRRARRRAHFDARKQAAANARASWEARQEELRAAIPWELWGRAQAAWGSELLPWEIGAAGQLFVRDRLRIRDVRLYVRDLLTEYSKLQTFAPQPAPWARCIDWERMLGEFDWPHHQQDLDKLLHFYPYLRSPFNYNCSSDPWEEGKPRYTPGHDGAGDRFKDEWWQQRWDEQEAARLAELAEQKAAEQQEREQREREQQGQEQHR